VTIVLVWFGTEARDRSFVREAIGESASVAAIE